VLDVLYENDQRADGGGEKHLQRNNAVGFFDESVSDADFVEAAV